MKVTRITKNSGKLETTQVDVPEPVYNVRIRPEIYEPCVTLAAQQSRSVTAQINYMLEQALQTTLK